MRIVDVWKQGENVLAYCIGEDIDEKFSCKEISINSKTYQISAFDVLKSISGNISAVLKVNVEEVSIELANSFIGKTVEFLPIGTLNDIVKVKFIGEDNPLSLRKGKLYEARILKKGWYGVIDETKEEYAYPPELFELV